MPHLLIKFDIITLTLPAGRAILCDITCANALARIFSATKQSLRRSRAPSVPKGDHIVEIGPGDGALTSALIPSGCRLDAVELDRDLRTLLLANFSVYSGFTLHSADALTFDYASLKQNEIPLRIVGNLPYNISTPLIFRLFECASDISDMHFMLQREVVDRLVASPGNKAWGRLGVVAQFQFEIEKLFEVPPEAFFPAPKVQSQWCA